MPGICVWKITKFGMLCVETAGSRPQPHPNTIVSQSQECPPKNDLLYSKLRSELTFEKFGKYGQKGAGIFERKWLTKFCKGHFVYVNYAVS